MSSGPERPLPFVSIVVPTLDEERSIAECLDAIAAQEWPADRFEVLVVLGPSRDRTREIVTARARAEGRLRLLENPGGLVAHALNLGIEAARGAILVRIDAHTLPAPDYLRRSVEALVESGAEVVGGPMTGRGSTPVGRAVALAMSHPFGVGTARFRFARQREEVDTVYLGAFPLSLFDRIGGFNEALVRNQDYEMNWRIRSSGGRVVVDPRIRSIYVTRSTLGAVWRQYRDYGFWKQRMLRLHPRSLRARQLVAPLFVLALGAGALAALAAAVGLLPRVAALPLALLSASYLAAASLVSLALAARHGWRLLPRLLAVFPTLHLAWGLGFLAAIGSRASGPAAPP